MKRRSVYIIAAAALVCVAAATVVWLRVPQSPSAEEQTMAYFSALADGDVGAVEASGVTIDANAAAAFSAASAYPRSATVESAATEGKTTIVTVSYLLGEKEYTSEIVMVHEDGRWVPESASAVGAIAVNESATIGGAVLAAGADSALLPAAYDLTVAPAQFLAGSVSVVVLPGTSQDVELDATLRPEATARAQKQLDDHARDCTRDAASAPASCGIVIPWAADFATVSAFSYRIEKLPTLSLTLEGFHAGNGVLAATVTGVTLDGAEQSMTYRTFDWAMRGDVSFANDDIVLSVW